MTNLLFVLPILFHLIIVKTEKILQFWDKKNSRCAWHVVPAQEVKERERERKRVDGGEDNGWREKDERESRG